MNLQPGRVLDVLRGFGLIPVTDRQYNEVVAYVGKRYAITASGIVLTENDRDGVVLTQERKSVGSFYISAKARRLQDALALPQEAPYLGREEDNDWVRDLRSDLL